MPATGLDRGIPASIIDKEDPQTVAIEEDPFDSVISETSLIVYGKVSYSGITAFKARHANLP